MTREVAAAAIVHHGRVLAARRTHPADVAGGWELPGGKIDENETVAAAVLREVREELACDVELVYSLVGRTAIKPGYRLTAHVARLVSGEPVPHEHDAARWLMPEELDDVDWLPSDRPFLPQLRELLLDGERLPGGNVGGATRVGQTVRRLTGAWTPAVHALLEHLAGAVVTETPRVLGIDERGREVLTYLDGCPADAGHEVVSQDVLVDAMAWLCRFHRAVTGFRHPGPWRTVQRGLEPGELICHNDFAPYNVAVSSTASGVCVVGVFDWDMAGPGLPIDDLAFAAWNWVPLHAELPASLSAQRLQVMAAAYGDGVNARHILDRVVMRMERSLEVIRVGQADGDPGMLNLKAVGEPARLAGRLQQLRARVPAIRSELVGAGR